MDLKERFKRARKKDYTWFDDGFGGESNIDPYFSSVVLLAANDGAADGTTTFTDQSSLANAITRIAGTSCQYSSLQTVGGLSTTVQLNGSGALEISDTANLEFGGSDFTIELWVRTASTGTQVCISKGDNTTLEFGWEIILIFGGAIGFSASSNGTSFNLHNNRSMVSSWSANTWYHLAVTRSGNVWRGFVNGVMGFEQTVAGSIADITSPVTVGDRASGAGSVNFGNPGYVGSVRLTNGVARYTGSFASPRPPLPIR